MSDEFSLGTLPPFPPQNRPSNDELIALANTAIESSRGLAPGAPQQGITVDLGNKQIAKLPDEVIDIIKDEIERLAIAHNQITAFPARLAECRRLRYLSGRYNSLKEFPRSLLNLPALEILDLRKNKIRSLPEDISSMKALKVLVLQRNRIERLPLSIGTMSRLTILKVNENPLVFPPVNLCEATVEDISSQGDNAIYAVTSRIKQFLREKSTSSSSANNIPKRQQSPDSESEASETNAETPRPYRPIGTRFPVRPSISGLDAMVNPSAKLSTSPDPPPPIPNRSHERMRSNQLPLSRKQPLLSPPETTFPASASFNESGGEVTVRPKRHGMITPRGPEGAAQQMALSPSALQEAFSSLGSRPASRAGSARSTSSLNVNSIVGISKIIYHTAAELCRRLSALRSLVELQTQSTLRSQIDAEVRSAISRSDVLQRSINRAPRDSGSGLPSRHIARPLVECLTSIAQLSRLLSYTTAMYCRNCTNDSYRQTFWNAYQEAWEIHVANVKMSEALASANHSRQTSTSSQSQYFQPFQSEYTRPAHLDQRGIMGRLNTLSPTSSAYSGVTLQPTYGSISSTLSPNASISNTSVVRTALPNTIGGLSRDDDQRQERAYDEIWNEVCRLLNAVCESSNENLACVQNHYRTEWRKALRQYDSDHELVKLLASLVHRCNGLIEHSNALSRRLDSLPSNNRSVRHSLDFWSYPRTVFLEWYAFAERIKFLPPVYNSEVKSLMKPIHQLIKAASAAVQNSPWGVYLQKSNYSNAPSGPAPTSGLPSAINTQHQSTNVGVVPSTPLSAALGPAAASALPTKSGVNRPSINFFERADRYATSSSARQPDSLYTNKRGA